MDQDEDMNGSVILDLNPEKYEKYIKKREKKDEKEAAEALLKMSNMNTNASITNKTSSK